MRRALLLVAVGLVTAAGVPACTAFEPEVGPLRDEGSSCGDDESSEYGADAADPDAANAPEASDDGGCASKG